MGILNILLENPFLLIVAISVLVSLFGKSKKTKNNETENEDEDVELKHETLEMKIEKKLKQFEDFFEDEGEDEFIEQPEKEKQPVYDAKNEQLTSIEEHRNRQMKELANRFKTDTDTPKELSANSNYIKNDMQTVVKKEEIKDLEHNLKSNLTKKGLRDSVVMAEVLGKPRSLSPYKSKIIN